MIGAYKTRSINFLLAHTFLTCSWILLLGFTVSAYVGSSISLFGLFISILPSMLLTTGIDLVHATHEDHGRNMVSTIGLVLLSGLCSWFFTSLTLLLVHHRWSIISFEQILVCLLSMASTGFASNTLDHWYKRNELYDLLSTAGSNVQEALRPFQHIVSEVWNSLLSLSGRASFFVVSGPIFHALAVFAPHPNPVLSGLLVILLVGSYLYVIWQLGSLQFEHTLITLDCLPKSWFHASQRSVFLILVVVSLFLGILTSSDNALLPTSWLVSVFDALGKLVFPLSNHGMSESVSGIGQRMHNFMQNGVPATNLQVTKPSSINIFEYVRIFFIIAISAVIISFFMFSLIKKRKTFLSYIVRWFAHLTNLFSFMFRANASKAKRIIFSDVQLQGKEIAQRLIAQSGKQTKSSNRVIKMYGWFIGLLISRGYNHVLAHTPTDIAITAQKLLLSNPSQNSDSVVLSGSIQTITETFSQEIFSLSKANAKALQDMEKAMKLLRSELRRQDHPKS